ncbi:MAG: hypothetical protein ACT4QE_24595 [Anaerolineales bacterium]
MTARTLPVDRFHIGVRLAALAWWLIATIVIFVAGAWLFSTLLGGATWVWLPWLVVTLLLSQVWGRWGEQQLMQRWPSGRAVELQGSTLKLHEKGLPLVFDLSHKVNFWRWRFQIKERRGGRVPRGHFCCAMRLTQDDAGRAASASLYAFVPPQQAEALKARFPFYDLRPAKEATSPTALLGGRDAAFLSAEKMRWENGAELETTDFEALLEHLNAHVPEFGAGATS